MQMWSTSSTRGSEMSGKVIDFTETNDLYMQMLWDARRIEDRRLARMLRDRIKQKTVPVSPIEAEPIEAVRNVIPLTCVCPSGPATGLMCEAEEEYRFWKQSRFWQEFIPFLAIFSFWLSWFVFFVTLLARDVTRG